MTVTLLSRDHASPGNAHVVRLNSLNQVIWAVAPEGGSDEFVQIQVESDHVKAWTWKGYLYLINYEDGRVQSIEFVK
jgi:hypothetical protein